MEVKDYQRLFSVGATEMKMKCRRDLDAGGEGGCSERGPPVLLEMGSGSVQSTCKSGRSSRSNQKGEKRWEKIMMSGNLLMVVLK